jgi:glycogen debranching enzyme
MRQNLAFPRVVAARKMHSRRASFGFFAVKWAALRFFIFWFALLFVASPRLPAQELELSRPARPWEFLCAVGSRAGLFGNEGGEIEAWVYPLKILRDFHLHFLTDGKSLPAETLVRQVTEKPESTTIVYAGDSFSVTETLFVPLNEPGAVISFQIETTHPLEIEVTFQRDFQLEWPAALGGTYESWDPALHAFYFGEEQKKYAALVGSPTAEMTGTEYATNYSSSQESVFRLGVTSKGKNTKLVAIVGSVNGRKEADVAYKRLLTEHAALAEESAKFYREYLGRTVSVNLPDRDLERAYDWARVSTVQGLVTNPALGTGLVAGYRTSGMGQRPGFAWFFGRDSFWTSLALNAEGDFSTARTALEFISKYQSTDGKIPHEISQGASFVPWFTDFPYPYASVDATPLYIIAANDYVTRSGDTAFAREKWDSLSKAYQFLRSTYDAQGLPQNFGFGHGWLEGGPLLPVKTELYQNALGAQALSALSNLAHFAGKDDVSQQLAAEFSRQKSLVDQSFWSADSGTYAFALDNNNQKVIEPSVLATVPMWFGLLNENNANRMITQLASENHQTDWGMRIISSRASRYDASGYHYGSVWPLFTGWASVGEYRYHRSLPAFLNLKANAELALDGSLGHVTEVLSGDYYQPLSTSSPHQIWSAAMVISPLLRGLFGLETSATERRVILAPHVPADWSFFDVRNIQLGTSSLEFHFRRSAGELLLTIKSTGTAALDFSPALNPHADVLGVELDGRRTPFHIEKHENDQHVAVHVDLKAGEMRLAIKLRNDFGIALTPSLPPLGSRSQGLRVLSESWSRSELALEIAGASGAQYEITMLNPSQVSSVEGGVVRDGRLVVQMPSTPDEPYPHRQVTIHFTTKP